MIDICYNKIISCIKIIKLKYLKLIFNFYRKIEIKLYLVLNLDIKNVF